MEKLLILILINLVCLGCSDDEANNKVLPESPLPAANPAFLSLPQLPDAGLCGDVRQLSGGDLLNMADRVGMGEVTKIEVVEQMSGASVCSESSYKWTLRVSIDITEAMKGEPGTLDVLIRPGRLDWSSQPMVKKDERWLPNWNTPPAVEVSASLGWTSDAGIQIGQQVFVFARQDDAGNFTTAEIPWGLVENNQVRFQSESLAGGCRLLPVAINSASIADVRAELLSAPIPANADVVSEQRAWMTSTTSTCQLNLDPSAQLSADAGN